MRIGMRIKYAGLLILVVFFFILAVQKAEAANAAKFTPSIQVDYNWNDNIMSVDVNKFDPITMQWLDYLVGIDFSYKTKATKTSVTGHIGYSQYISASANYKQQFPGTGLQKYDYTNMDLTGDFQYFSKGLSIDLTDTIKHSRNFSDIFGGQENNFSNYYLYTDNLASVQVGYKTKTPLSTLVRYENQTTVFDNPPIAQSRTMPNSYANTIYLKPVYAVNPRMNVGLDIQGGQRIYSDVHYYVSGIKYDMKISDYNFAQAMAEVTYRLSTKANLIADAGVYYRDFFDQDVAVQKIKGYTIPVGKIGFNQSVTNKYTINFDAIYSTNTYGMNLYFTYWQLDGDFKYYIAKPLYVDLGLIYKQDYYNRDKLDMARVWAHDRIDNVFLGMATVNWDILRKREVPYLTLLVEYQYQLNDSNMNSPEDFLAQRTAVMGTATSYSTKVDSISAQIKFSPTIFFGPR